MIRLARFALGVCALALVACSGETPKAPAADPFAPPGDLAATFVEGKHVDLRWKNNASEAGGAFLEFNMNPGEEYTILEIVAPETASHRHPDVAPDTRFGYRVRPFFGRASSVAEILTGAAPAKPPEEEEGPLGPAEKSPSDAASVRALDSLDAARPVGVTASLASPTTVDIRWRDRARDEDGYLVEVRFDPTQPFRVCALLPPDTTSFRKIRLPENTRCYFRVRAYFLGAPSAPTTLHTPAAEPPRS